MSSHVFALTVLFPSAAGGGIGEQDISTEDRVNYRIKFSSGDYHTCTH